MPRHLPFEKKTTVIQLLCEGSGIRSVERVTGVHRDTVMRLGARVGGGCRQLLDDLMRDLPCRALQIDEQWTYVGMKERKAQERGRPDLGDTWIWVALDSENKLVPCFAVGDRSQAMADSLMYDLASRLRGRPQISTDAFPAYPGAIEKAFGSEVDYGVVVKEMDTARVVTGTKKCPVQGNPDRRLISTSHIESQNRTTRIHMARLGRMTSKFSKKRENLEAAVALHFAYYNLCKYHSSLECTPAMEAGVTPSCWGVADLVAVAEERAVETRTMAG